MIVMTIYIYCLQKDINNWNTKKKKNNNWNTYSAASLLPFSELCTLLLLALPQVVTSHKWFYPISNIWPPRFLLSDLS